MKVVFLDIETYYDNDYSLRFMTPVEYILDPRFQLNGMAVQEGLDGEAFWLDGPDVPNYLRRLGSNVCSVSHNALFDACALAWRYNFIPKLLSCTLSIASATIRHSCLSMSLSSVAKYLKLGEKGNTIVQVKGMSLLDIKQAGLYPNYVSYGIDDVELCARIFKALVVDTKQFPMSELPILDMVLRMAVEPRFVLNRDILYNHLGNVMAAKSEALSVIGSDVKSVRQDETFANMLRSHGVEPPTKISPITGKLKYAFAKTDEAFLELQEHEDPFVQALVSARLGAKSTIEETRTQRFISISNLQWPNITSQSNMPMPIKFSGAHTHRCSGDWKLNVQNMPRGGMLRKALRAPPGYKVLTIDSSQVEARLVAFLAGQKDLIGSFAAGEDVYSSFASRVYGRPINKAVDKTERFIGKTSVLGLGFGMGWEKFQRQVKTMSKNQLGHMIKLEDTASMQIVNTYRSTYPKIPAVWQYLIHEGLPALTGKGQAVMLGPVLIEKGLMHIPGRLKMFYNDVRFEQELGWVFTFAGKTKRIYGGKMLENIVQYLDRIVVFDAALRIQRRLNAMGLKGLAQQAHDENAYVIPEEAVDDVKPILMEEMTRRPEWGLELPLMAEIGVGDSYGEAK